MQADRKKHGALYVKVTAVSVAVVLLFVLLHGPVTRQLDAWKLLPQPESFTTLHFSEPSKLPVPPVPAGNQTVLFSVGNQEHRTTRYAYTVYQAEYPDGGRTPLAEGTLILEQGQTKRLAVPIVTTDTPTSSAVQVVIRFESKRQGNTSLRPQSQVIQYWLDKNND
ncbi:MAG TPA: hypothetical protein VD735_00305 [Candidatus Saccharimonadales bacterium]|nr:hypothetical protein [Candidatus Saccharimonadales bacterium]